MKTLLMFVYGDILTDARVQRSAIALSSNYDVTVVCTQCYKDVSSLPFKCILVGGKRNGYLNLLSCIINTIQLVRKSRPDVFYAHDYYSAIIVNFLKKTRDCGKIVYDAHELIIPEIGLKNRRLSFFYRFEKKIVKKVDLLICASKERGDIMKQHYGLESSPLVIRNISQLFVSDDNETKDILNKLDCFFKKPGIVVVYAGVVGNTRKVDSLFDAVSRLSPRFKLLIVGSGPSLESIKEKANKESNLICAFTGKIPYKSLGAVLCKCDVGYIFYPSHDLNNKYCASNKIFEYASVNLPMIANTNPTIKQILETNKLGISSDDFYSSLLKISADRKLYKESCADFTNRNPWSAEAQILCNAVMKID